MIHEVREVGWRQIMCVLSLERERWQGLGEGLTTDGLIRVFMGRRPGKGLERQAEVLAGTLSRGTEEPWEDLEQGRGRGRSEHRETPLRPSGGWSRV